MKNIKKISIIIILLTIIGLTFSNYSQASEIGNIFSSADEFLSKGDSIGSTIKEDELKSTSNFMYKLLMAIGIIVMFIVGTVIGIQYMVASAEDKAKVKESLVPYIVGCIVIFGAFTIWSIAVNIGQEATDATGVAYTDVYKINICPYCEIQMYSSYCGGCGRQVFGPKIQYECINCNHKFNELNENEKRCPNCKLAINRFIEK